MSWSRSSAQTLWYYRKGLVIRNKLANYESPISCGKKAISKQKLWQTDRQTDEGTDRQTDGLNGVTKTTNYENVT